MSETLNDLKRLPTTAVDPEVIAALEHLSAVTGLAKTYLIRSILMTALTDLGLISNTTTPPTPTRRKDR